MAKKLPDTTARVIENTKEAVNLAIRRDIEAKIFYYAEHTDKIDGRLAELEREWDIERTLETNAAAVSLIGIMLAARHRKCLILPLAVAGFLLQHALQGWCPPVEIFRRIGVRTEKEINIERTALRLLKGDFDDVNVSEIDNANERAQKVVEALESIG